ncbi:hypothetical protein BFP72_10860 [Reichenbachiella sp. 5M10]|uniref:DUF2490 domain-containing protein n=1 Tax=Reichenbachiella sp. 5M10 TaxID=1889772 RepID=UPI000C146CAD|nr:DUF2490 domain-containing protein [Reichenbachiella sp. 5M10]PIB35858.1 hypothetical protein BFP72_10860 [Reichenbachiella sp. 5M10]
MKNRLNVLLLLLSLSLCNHSYGQLSPPGMGVVHTAEWFALGLQQKLDAAGRIKSMTYLGMGRTSNPDNYNPSQRPSIWVLNQEVSHRYSKHWQYSLALSYRRQHRYALLPPFESETPDFKQELRFYGRYSYILENTRLKFASTLRQELRLFYTPEFHAWESNLQFRTRLKAKLTVNLDQHKTHQVLSSLEMLLSMSHSQTNQEEWDTFDYKESRFCFYYAYSPQRTPVTVHIGYMNDFIGKKVFTNAHYLALDLIVKNPFGKH